MNLSRLIPALLVASLAAVALVPSAASATVRSVGVSGAKAGAGGVPGGVVRVTQKAYDLEPNALYLTVYEWGTRNVGTYEQVGCGNLSVCSASYPLAAFTRIVNGEQVPMRLKRFTFYVVRAQTATTGGGPFTSPPMFTAFFTP